MSAFSAFKVISQAMTKNSVVLGAFALVTAGILATTFQLTKHQIAQAEKKAAQKALFEIIPATIHDNNLLEDIYPLNSIHMQQLNLKSLKADDTAAIHIAKKNGCEFAAIIPSVAPDGYSGSIKMIIGIDIKGEIRGVRVLNHKETPGLGDKVDLNKHNWILSFNQKSLTNPKEKNWQVKKDGGEFDAFTGATITPRAVVNQVYKTLLFFKENKHTIFNHKNNDCLNLEQAAKSMAFKK